MAIEEVPIPLSPLSPLLKRRLMRPLHFPIGYLVVSRDKPYLVGTSIAYCGIDRLPPFIDPSPEIRSDLGVPLEQDPKVYGALSEYFDLTTETPFFASFERGRSLSRRLSSLCDLELLFCDCTVAQEEAIPAGRYPTNARKVPDILSECMGYDVCWPNAVHSAIFQPGTLDRTKRWQAKLNQFGLLDNYSDALELKAEYLKVYPHPPFDVFRVFRCD